MEQLRENYLQVIDRQRAHLANLQEDFHKYSDAVTKDAIKKLKKFKKKDIENRRAVIEEQKALLENALEKLQEEIRVSQKETMRQLEEIHSQREQKVLEDLEAQLENL